MARIRTVKPDYFTDGKIRRLSDSCTLFFIGLWLHCDDYGYFSSDTLELSLVMPRWRSQSLFGMLSSLSANGLVRLCSPLGVGLVVGWKHQRIKDRNASKWVTMDNNGEIPWDEIKVNAQTSDRKPLGEERRGKESRGEDIKPRSENPPAVFDEPQVLVPEVATIKTPGSVAFDAYSEAYRKKYGEPPVRNKKVNTQFKYLTERLGSDAPEVARFYVGHSDFLYTKSMHTADLLLRDAEKLRTEWATGVRMTSTIAKSAENTDHYRDQMDRAKRGLI